MTEIRAFRGKFDTTRGALYHPWIEIFDPLQRPALGAPPPRILLPPSGFVTGIYARSDIQRGVFKAPANEVVQRPDAVRGQHQHSARQDVLNPEGINALRFFEGRGNRVWGARTMSRTPSGSTSTSGGCSSSSSTRSTRRRSGRCSSRTTSGSGRNIRQHRSRTSCSCSGGTARCWATKPEEAFFVRCDRTTMTQNDLDNGRLICLIGVAPTKPAEFVIFRIGQWTADASS